MSGECPKCLGLDWNCECHDGREREEPVARFVPAPPGECVGCGRKVRMRFRKEGRQAGACVACLWNALTKSRGSS